MSMKISMNLTKVLKIGKWRKYDRFTKTNRNNVTFEPKTRDSSIRREKVLRGYMYDLGAHGLGVMVLVK